MKIVALTGFVVLTVAAGSNAYAGARASYEACAERASIDGAFYPQRLDKDTVILGVGCRQEGARIVFAYDARVEGETEKFLRSSMDKQKIALRNGACTDPKVKNLLELVDMEYVYSDSSRKFIGRITNRIEDCVGIKVGHAAKLEGVGKEQSELARQAKAGNARAQYNLGVAYKIGDGVPKDDKKALDWYQKAAAQNYPEAIFQVGLHYQVGTGVPSDDAKGIALIKKAADLGVADAQYILGKIYAEGQEGVAKDPVKAAEWLQKAAAQGIGSAQLTLGVKYATGEGVGRDMIKAYAWFGLASNQGNIYAASNRDRAAKMLSPEQRGIGDRMVTNWMHGQTF